MTKDLKQDMQDWQAAEAAAFKQRDRNHWRRVWAGQAMAALWSNPSLDIMEPGEVAQDAIEQSSELLKQIEALEAIEAIEAKEAEQ